MKTSAEIASELLQSLIKDLSTSGAVAGIVINDLISKAAELQDRIMFLNEAAAADKA